MWFNQVPTAPIPAYKKAWFASRNSRRAVSEAINRDDLCKVIYKGHAQPAVGILSPANRFWFNSDLRPHPHDVASALHPPAAGRLLAAAVGSCSIARGIPWSSR